jgi:hypothetical protein
VPIAVLKGHALRIVFREPGFRGIGIREDLEVIAVSNLLAGVVAIEKALGNRDYFLNKPYGVG